MSEAATTDASSFVYRDLTNAQPSHRPIELPSGKISYYGDETGHAITYSLPHVESGIDSFMHIDTYTKSGSIGFHIDGFDNDESTIAESLRNILKEYKDEHTAAPTWDPSKDLITEQIRMALGDIRAQFEEMRSDAEREDLKTLKRMAKEEFESTRYTEITVISNAEQVTIELDRNLWDLIQKCRPDDASNPYTTRIFYAILKTATPEQIANERMMISVIGALFGRNFSPRATRNRDRYSGGRPHRTRRGGQTHSTRRT